MLCCGSELRFLLAGYERDGVLLVLEKFVFVRDLVEIVLEKFVC